MVSGKSPVLADWTEIQANIAAGDSRYSLLHERGRNVRIDPKCGIRESGNSLVRIYSSDCIRLI